MRRLQQEQGAGSDGGQCGLQQAQFTAARLRCEQFGERARGPAATRQFGGQRGMAARHHAIEAGGQLRSSPQGGVDVFGVTRQGAHGAITLYGYTVSSVALILEKCKRRSGDYDRAVPGEPFQTGARSPFSTGSATTAARYRDAGPPAAGAGFPPGTGGHCGVGRTRRLVAFDNFRNELRDLED